MTEGRRGLRTRLQRAKPSFEFVDHADKTSARLLQVANCLTVIVVASTPRV